MAGMGRAPKPADQQRRPGRGLGANALTRLPAAGRQGDPPTWPLLRPTKREQALWKMVWALPQAIAWEQQEWFHEVALYVRLLVASEKKDCPVNLIGERRQQADRLGLNPMAMLRLRWEVVDMGGEADPENVADLRARIKAVDAMT